MPLLLPFFPRCWRNRIFPSARLIYPLLFAEHFETTHMKRIYAPYIIFPIYFLHAPGTRGIPSFLRVSFNFSSLLDGCPSVFGYTIYSLHFTGFFMFDILSSSCIFLFNNCTRLSIYTFTQNTEPWDPSLVLAGIERNISVRASIYLVDTKAGWPSILRPARKYYTSANQVSPDPDHTLYVL